ncbi:MAG: hypothetical protein ACI97A_002871 [Planctomycetota bacterium]|jgi:hypothetical protein
MGVVCPGQSPLTTSLSGAVPWAGCMFDVKSLTGVSVNDFDIAFTGTSTVEIWALNFPGSFVGNVNSNANWTLLRTVTGVIGSGISVPIPLGINLGFPVPVGATQAFYITITTGVMWTNLGTTVGAIASATSDLEFLEGHAGPYFGVSNSPYVFNGKIHYTPLANAVNDIALHQVTAPRNDTLLCNPLTTVESVSIEIANAGINAISTATLLQVEYQINDDAPVFEFFNLTATFFPGAIIPYTFLATVDLSTVDQYEVRVKVGLPADSDVSNNEITFPLGSGGRRRVDRFPYYEDFSVVGSNGDRIPPFGYINEVGDSVGLNNDWLMRNNATPSFFAGPSADHSFGVSGVGGYAHVEDNGNLGPIKLRSPCFDLTQLTNPQLSFYLHSDTLNPLGSQNRLSIDVIIQPINALIPDFYGPQDQLGTGWTKQTVDLSVFAGSIIQLVFRTETMSSSNSSHDVAIDDISIAEIRPTPGQSPRLGTAVLHINDPININGDPVQFEKNGPYYTFVEPEENVVFRLVGEPAMPVILLAGPLNPTSATFGGIGNFDIGGPRDLTTGLPTSLTIVGDGTAVGLINSIFVTDPQGEILLGALVPNLPPGVLSTFQCVFLTSAGSGLALSNAVQLEIL